LKPPTVPTVQTATKLNESYSVIDADMEMLIKINDYLRVERPGAYFDALVKRGFKSPYDYFSSVQNNKLLVMNGHLSLLSSFGIFPHKHEPDYSINELNDFLNSMKSVLPFTPHDFQAKTFVDSLSAKTQINKCCTSSGKSLTISLIAEFFRRKGKKGLLLVPNISLLTQFKNDIKEYNLTDLYDSTHIIGGGCTERHFNNPLTISTWQSLKDVTEGIDELDYVICDEAHRFASEVTSDIVSKTVNAQYKLGFTGTLPDNPVQKMQLIGLFGLPKTFITSRELIDRGLGTPINIKTIILNYELSDVRLFNSESAYPKKLQFIKEHESRNEFLVSLMIRLKRSNTLVLYQHTLHGKQLFTDVMKKLHPDVEVKNKDITGKKSFEFQEQYSVFFLNGEDNAKTREQTRKILEEHKSALLIANFQILGTGVSIKQLHNLVLASPLKSYTTVTQSIGRLMRLHPDKERATVFDIVDDFGIRKPGGIFFKQYNHRKATSYLPEEFPITENIFKLK